MIGALKDMTGSTAAGMYALAAVLVLGCIAVLCTPAKLVNK
jgi:MFS-type transporter involved in bile tolerance (Atg22 family)